MRKVCLLLFFGMLFSCDSKNQRQDEAIQMDTTANVDLSVEGTQSSVAKTSESSPAKPFSRSASQLENFRSIENYQPGKSSAELSIQDFVNRLGKTNFTIKDTDTLCPIGQLHFWNVKDQGYRIFALGDEYSGKDNLMATCRLYGIQLMNETASPAYEAFPGVTLGEEADQVEEKLQAFVQKNPAYRYEKLKGKSAVERFLTEKLKSVFVLTNGEHFYHFAIGKKQKLNYILISAVNVREAC